MGKNISIKCFRSLWQFQFDEPAISFMGSADTLVQGTCNVKFHFI